MMKERNSRKKGIRSLALLLVLILAIGFSPVTNVEAKAAPRLNYRKVTLVQGKKKRLKVRNLSRRRRKVKWYSTKKSVATVNRKGVVKAKRKGKAYIVAKIGRKKYRCKVIVKKKVRRKKKKTKKSNKKKVSIPKKDKKQLPAYNFSFYPKSGYVVGTSLDFFTTLVDPYGKDESHISDYIRAKYFRWCSSNKSVISFNSRGIATFKKAGRANVYCRHLDVNGKWYTTRTVSIKVADGGNVKFSYTISLEESPFNYKRYKVWDFYRHDSYVESLPKFNTLTVRIQNNSPKDITIRGISLDVDTTPKSIDFETADKKKVIIPANSTKEVKYYASCAYDCFDQKVLRNYIIDREVLKTVGIGYNYGKIQVVADNDFGSSYWRYYY